MNQQVEFVFILFHKLGNVHYTQCLQISSDNQFGLTLSSLRCSGSFCFNEIFLNFFGKTNLNIGLNIEK